MHFKSKGEVIVMGDLNARTRILQLDAQHIDMPCSLGRAEDTSLFEKNSMDAKKFKPDMYGKLLLHMCNNTYMFIGNGIPL